MSFQTALIVSFFLFASSRFRAVLSTRSALKHLLTSRFALLQPPITLWRKPWAWHSSRICITSSQPDIVEEINDDISKQICHSHLYYPWCGDEDALLLRWCGGRHTLIFIFYFLWGRQADLGFCGRWSVHLCSVIFVFDMYIRPHHHHSSWRVHM